MRRSNRGKYRDAVSPYLAGGGVRRRRAFRAHEREVTLVVDACHDADGPALAGTGSTTQNSSELSTVAPTDGSGRATVSGGLFAIRDGDRLVAMNPSAYVTEAELQELLARVKSKRPAQ